MKKVLLTLAAGVLCLTACQTAKQNEKPVEKQQVAVENGRFTPEVMWSLGVMSEYAVSPDGSQVLYTVRYTDMEQNKNNAEMYLMPIEGGEGTRLTTTPQSEFCPAWFDAENIMFCRGTQIIKFNLKSKKETVVADNERGFEGFKLAPDRSSIVYISTIPIERPENIDKLFKGLNKSTGRINEDLMYRHWDNWVDEIPKIYLASFQNGKIDISNAIDIVEGPYECPMRPWGGTEQYNYSPDGKQIVYTCRKKTGYDYAHSTNSDIYLYDIATGETRNLSEGIMGYDQNPVFSHDGKMVAWESMERDGYESDKLRLMVMDLESGAKTDLTESFDYGVMNILWSNDDSEIYAIVMYRGMNEIFAFNRETHAIRQLSHGYHDVNAIQMAGSEMIVANQASIQYPGTLYAYSINDDKAEGKKLSTFNDDVLSQVRMGEVKEQWVKTVDGKDMLTWIIYPYDYDSTKVYPALLFCEGGPQTMVSQFWSTRWNFEVMSGAGYFVIAPNRRGVPGFGMEWLEEISGDYGGLCMQDYMAATDWAAANIPQIDRERIGACGASFGGYSIYWLAGHNHDVKGYNEGRRFKAFLAHNGMFNFEQQCLETEELWFTGWDLGGPYWEKNAKTANSYANSPHLFVDKWNTPLCVVHSEFDFRIVASEGMAAYNAAQIRHIPSRYLYFPDETHWVLKPQNSLLWHRNFIDWFDQWLKK